MPSTGQSQRLFKAPREAFLANQRIDHFKVMSLGPWRTCLWVCVFFAAATFADRRHGRIWTVILTRLRKLALGLNIRSRMILVKRVQALYGLYRVVL